VFLCNQRTAYVQTTVYAVRIAAEGRTLHIEELDYATRPSPCDPGDRDVTTYAAGLSRAGLTLRWGDGEQVLVRADAAHAAADLEVAAPAGDDAARLAGAWHWSLRSWNRQGLGTGEDEAWELAVGADGTIGGTYRREVVVWSTDGAPIPCADAITYRFVDRYTIRGRVDGDGLWLEEVSVDAGAHPCLEATPDRHLDTATGTTDGDHLILTWRGHRRQVLYRR
jgi:hypothetical protein